MATHKYERATAYVEGIGDKLDLLQGRDVIVHRVSIAERSMRGEMKAFVELQIAEVNEPDTISTYHAWSESLAQKFSEIPVDKFPVIAKFGKVATAGGFQVWSFE